MLKRLTLALAFALLAAAPASAGTRSGITLPDNIQIGGQTLVLNGMAVRTKLIIDVYVAGLYLPQKEKAPERILQADSPRRMLLHMVYSVSKKQIAEAWEDGLKANTPNASDEVKRAFTTLSGWMEDIKKGQRLVFTYVPGKGTEVEVNGKVKGTLPGKATADAILSTWIGPKPGPGGRFKRHILGS